MVGGHGRSVTGRAGEVVGGLRCHQEPSPEGTQVHEADRLCREISVCFCLSFAPMTELPSVLFLSHPNIDQTPWVAWSTS